ENLHPTELLLSTGNERITLKAVAKRPVVLVRWSNSIKDRHDEIQARLLRAKAELKTMMTGDEHRTSGDGWVRWDMQVRDKMREVRALRADVETAQSEWSVERQIASPDIARCRAKVVLANGVVLANLRFTRK